jgi:hypothetical protein
VTGRVLDVDRLADGIAVFSLPCPVSSALNVSLVRPSTVMVPAPPSSIPSSDGTEIATCISALVVTLPVSSMIR